MGKCISTLVSFMAITGLSCAEGTPHVADLVTELVATWQRIDEDVQLYLVGEELDHRYQNAVQKNREHIAEHLEAIKAEQSRLQSIAQQGGVTQFDTQFLAHLRRELALSRSRSEWVPMDNMCAEINPQGPSRLLLGYSHGSLSWANVALSGDADMSGRTGYEYGKAARIPALEKYCHRNCMWPRHNSEESQKEYLPGSPQDRARRQQLIQDIAKEQEAWRATPKERAISQETQLREGFFTNIDYDKLTLMQKRLESRITESLDSLVVLGDALASGDPALPELKSYLSEATLEIAEEVAACHERRELLRHLKQGEETTTHRHTPGITQEQIDSLKMQNDMAFMRTFGDSDWRDVTRSVLRDSRTRIENLTPRESATYTETTVTQKWYLLHNGIVDLTTRLRHLQDREVQLIAISINPETVLTIPQIMKEIANTHGLSRSCSMLKAYAVFKRRDHEGVGPTPHAICPSCRGTGRGSLPDFIEWMPPAAKELLIKGPHARLKYPVCGDCAGEGRLRADSAIEQP